MNKALFLREMKKSVKLLLLFAAVITLYVSCIIYLYDPETTEMLNRFVEVMPELMAAVGMGTIAGDLLEFMVSWFLTSMDLFCSSFQCFFVFCVQMG